MKRSISKKLLEKRLFILEHFKGVTTRILKTTDLELILRELKLEEMISRRTTIDEVATILSEENIFRKIELHFPKEHAVRFVRNGVSPYEIALTLRTSCYFSHLSALYLNNLIETTPRLIYVNSEQSPKPPIIAPLSQQSIDLAFKSPQRKTKSITTFNNFDIHLLNGMYTDQLGVGVIDHHEGKSLTVSTVDRALIDAVVRPVYSGGPSTILEAFRHAGETGQCSAQTILSYLDKLNYKYPYLQAIGFYLERSAVYADQLQMIYDRCPLEFDFYLSHKETDFDYSSRWKIFYPNNLKSY